MIKQSNLLKATNTRLNTYDKMYDMVSKKPLFNQEDWVSSANDGTLDVYINALFKSDNINIKEYNEKYNTEFADSKTRLMALYNEVDADRTNVDTKRKRYVDNPNGSTGEEEFLASDYSYNLELIRQHNDANQQMNQRRIAQDIKESADFGEHLLSGTYGTITSLTYGVQSAMDDLISLVASVGDTIVKGGNVDNFVETLASDKYRPFAPINQSLIDFETNYTTMRDMDGNYSNWGKYVGGTMTSLGQMLPSMLAGAGLASGLTKAGVSATTASTAGSILSQSSFYAGMAAGNVQDAYKQFEAAGADIEGASILANAGIKSVLQWGIEKGLGKVLGSTSLDNMVFGTSMSSTAAKSLTGAGVKNVFKDVLQEGLEEVLQDTSDFLVDRGFSLYIKEYGELSGISWQSLLDAFIIGGIMSFAGSARNILTADRVIGADGKKLNKIASWQYGINMQSFAESVKIIEDRANYFKTSDTTFTKRELSDIDKTKIQAATLEAYASYRMITSIYSEIGEDRFKAANEVLDKITEDIKAGKFDAITANDYTNKLKDQLAGISLAGLTKIAKKLQDDGVSKVNKIVDKSTSDKDSVTTKAKELINELNVECVNVVDGNVKEVVDESLTIDGNTIENYSVEEILKNISVKRFVGKINEWFIKIKHIDDLKKLYSDFTGKKDFDSEELISALLFDTKFLSTCFEFGDKDFYRILSYLNTLIDEVKDKRIKSDAIYLKVINESKKHVYECLMSYVSVHVNADLSYILDFVDDKIKRKELEQEINKRRYVIRSFSTLIDNGFDSLKANEQNLLTNLIKRYYNKNDADRRLKLLISKDRKDRFNALNGLYDKLNVVYEGLYDDVTYLRETSIPNRVFNLFLKNNNLTLKTIFDKESLSLQDTNYILSNYDKLNLRSILKYRNEQFSMMCNGKYVINKVGNKCTVTSSSMYLSDFSDFQNLVVSSVNQYQYLDDEKLKMGTDYKSHHSTVSKFLSKNVPKRLHAFMTVNDIIINTDLINEDTRNEIINFAKNRFDVDINGLDSEIVYWYLKDYYVNNYDLYLTELQDGSYVLCEMTGMLDCLIDKNKNIEIDSTINDLIKSEYIPEGLSIEFYESKKENDVPHFVDYEEGILVNKIYIPVEILKNQNYAKFAVLHELQHAIQFEKNMNFGNGLRWIDTLSKEDQKKIIKIFKKHYSKGKYNIVDKNMTDDEVLNRARYIGYFASGELLSFGIYTDPTIKFLPFRISSDRGVMTMHFPSGESFKLGEYKQNTDLTVDYQTITRSPNIHPQMYINGEWIEEFDTIDIRKPGKNELSENDRRAKDFVKSGTGSNPKYKARYYVLNEDGTQKLHKDGTPAYHYVYGSSEDRSKGRYVSKNKYKGTNLEFFNKKYTPLQMTKEMQNFLLSAKDLDPVLQERINGSKKGTLTEKDVMDYFRSSENIDNKTFKAINDAFFKNEHIETFSDLKQFIIKLPQAWAYSRMIREYPSMKKYASLLKNEDVDLNFLIEAIEKNKDVNIGKSFANKLSRYDTFNDRSLEIFEEYVRTSAMKKYDGTLYSMWEVAANVRYPAIHNYEITHKVQLPNEFVTEAYQEMMEDVSESKKQIIEYIKKKKMYELYQKEIEEYGSVDDAAEAHIYYLTDELESELNSMSLEKIKDTYGDNGELSRMIAEAIAAEVLNKPIDLPKNLPETTSRELVARIRGFLRTIRSNLSGNELAKFVEKHSDIFDKNLKLRRDVYQKEIPNKTLDGVHYRNKEVSELKTLFDKIVELKDEVLENKRKNKDSIRIKNLYDKTQTKKIKELERELERVRSKNKKINEPIVTEFVVEEEIVKIRTDIKIPDILKKFLQTQYDKRAKTTVKNLTDDNETHVKMITKDFYERNAELLNSLTQGDVDEIVDFYLKSSVPLNDINAPYIATETWLLTFLIENGRKGSSNFVIDSNTLNKLESTLQNMESIFGTGMVVWRNALKKLNPQTIIAKQMALKIGIEVSDDDVAALLKAVESRDMTAVEKEKNRIYTKLLEEVRKNNQDRKTLDKVLDKILQYERLAMLSGPGTWVRNWVSNQIIEGSNKLSDGMNGKLDNLLTKLFPSSKKVTNQYKIAGTQVSTDVANYISENLINNGLLDMVMDALGKYDVRNEHIGDHSVTVLTDLISNSITSSIHRTNLSDNEIVSKIEKFIRQRISDDKSVKKAAIRYLGKMISEDLENGRIKSKTEVLSKNRISKQFLNYVAEAYKFAAYDYMHKPNFIMNFESKLAKKNFGAYFMYKQIFPFAGASWNWFIEGFNYTPIGLAKSIINFAKLENTVEKMDEARRTYKNRDVGLSSNFAKYITLRNINKGIIGSVGFLIGALLVGFGWAEIDEEDDKYKLIIADSVKIDISDVFGTQGIFLGMAITGSLKRKESFDDIFAAGLDQCFMDSTFADVFNNFRYSKSFGEWLTYQPYNMLNMMIPNFVKTVTSISTPYRVDYSDGILGKVEKLLVNAIPGISYAFPHYYDPYTGEKQISQKLWPLTKIVDKLTPFGLSIYNVSDLEKLSIEYGINKTQLSGRYNINDEDVKLSSKEVEKLNMYYGQLNATSFKELQSGSTAYKIQQKDGSYKKIRWQQMSDKEKAAIVSRIMTNNSGYAKIYSLTQSGKYKYYASESEYKELKSLGIIKNVYKASGKNKGFVKIN